MKLALTCNCGATGIIDKIGSVHPPIQLKYKGDVLIRQTVDNTTQIKCNKCGTMIELNYWKGFNYDGEWNVIEEDGSLRNQSNEYIRKDHIALGLTIEQTVK